MEMAQAQAVTDGLLDTSWWDKLEHDPKVQFWVPEGLAMLYGILAIVAGMQLFRIQMRVPEYGWTTQKVFHLLNMGVGLLRLAVFLSRTEFEKIGWPPAARILVDIPCLLFFTTYTLLTLFWTEIYHQARGLPTASLRPGFIAINVFVYVCEISILTVELVTTSQHVSHLASLASSMYLCAVSVLAAVCFIVTGGRLFLMLQKFPIESKGRKKKLWEVGMVTAICTTAFIVRAVLVALSTFNNDSKLDVLSHPILNAIYYVSVELIPAALVLFILRKLPPKKTENGYHQISSGP